MIYLHEAAQACNWLFERVWPVVRDFAGPLIPEDFWYKGVERGDQVEMVFQLQRAKKSEGRLIGKVEEWTVEQRVVLIELFDRLDEILSDIEAKETPNQRLQRTADAAR